MGFGFYLFGIFILLLLVGVLLIVWIVSKKRIIGKTLGIILFGIFGGTLFIVTIQLLIAKTELDKQDYYGEYVINRSYFKGEQTDWQYNHFRFKISEQDSLFFYVTDKEKILKTYKGTIKTTNPKNHKSDRLLVEMKQPTHHILESNPTTYRSAWSFYLVFHSPQFHNVFFKKGKWKPIE